MFENLVTKAPKYVLVNLLSKQQDPGSIDYVMSVPRRPAAI